MTFSITLGVGLATSPVATAPAPAEHAVTLAALPRDALILDSGAARGNNAANLALSGTTDAPDGTRIMAEIVTADGGAVVAGARPVATASGGAWSGDVAGIARNAAWLRPRVWAEGSVAKATTTGRFASGHVIAIWGQSEIQNLTAAFYNGTAGSVTVDEMVSIHYHDRNPDGTGDAGVTHRLVSNGETNSRFVAMANSLIAARPGEKFAVILQTDSGTGYEKLLNDSVAGRAWSDDLALHETATGGGTVGIVAFNWYASPATFGSAIGEVTHQMVFGETVAGAAIGSTPVSIDGRFAADHLLTELYDWTVTKFTMLEPYRFEPTNNPGIQTIRNSVRAMYAASAEPALAGLGHPVLHYANGNDDGAGGIADEAHPRAGDGSERFGVGMVQSVLRAAGLTSWQLPTIDSVYWEPAGAYVDLWSSAGPIRANVTPPVGVFINGTRADPTIVNDGGPAGDVAGALRVASADVGGGAAFASSTLLEFAPDSTGLLTEAEVLDGWNRYPLVDVGAPGMPDGVPLANDPDPAILASTIAGAPTFAINADTWLQADTAHPNATQPYTFAVRAAFGATSAFDTLFRDNENRYIVQLRDTGAIQYGVGGAYTTTTTSPGLWTPGVTHDFVLSMDPATGDFRVFVDGVAVVSLAGSPWTWSAVRKPRFLGGDIAGTGLTGIVESITLWRAYSATGAPAGPPHKTIEGDLAAVTAAANTAPEWPFFIGGTRQ